MAETQLAMLSDPMSKAGNEQRWEQPEAVGVLESTAAEQIATLERSVLQFEARLRDSENRHRYACELGNQIPWMAAPNGDLLELSPRWTTLTGISVEGSLGTGWTAAIHRDDIGWLGAAWQRALTSGEGFEANYRLGMCDGTLRWVHVRAAPHKAEDGSVVCWYGTIEDIHDRTIAEAALKESEAVIRSILESTTDHVVFLDHDWRIAFMNERGSEFVRKSRNGKVGDLYCELYADHRDSVYEQHYREAIAKDKPVSFETYVPHLDIWLDFNACPTGGGLAIFFRDITESKRSSDALFRLAHRDMLTGLANRTAFNRALEEASAERAELETSVLLLDLDLFKEVNDTLGHSAGDHLLCEVAQRLLACVSADDVLARLGGDEFAVVHRSDPAGQSAEVLAHKMMSGLSAPFVIDGVAIKLAASIGIATSLPGDDAGLDLFKAADIALYRAKDAGRGVIRTFDTLMANRVRARQSMKFDLEAALERGELRVVYQPIVDLGTGFIAGAEALLRWRHPTWGEVSPAEFIPLAEEMGLIIPIGDWVLNEACREAASWPNPCSIAVNLSPVQIRDETLPLRVATALSTAGLVPGRLELEITESVLLHDSDWNLSVLKALRTLGVRIALDDFGTGYSSLSYLHHFPFDKLKLDRCFVNDLSSSPQSQAIARAAGEMGRAFSMTTTAEGVETQEQLEWLRANGWTQAQGYHIDRPMDVSAIRSMFDRITVDVAKVAV